MKPEQVPDELVRAYRRAEFDAPLDDSHEVEVRHGLAAALTVHERQVRERDAHEIEETIDYDVKTDFDRGMAYAVEILRGAKEPSPENRPVGRREIERQVREQVAEEEREIAERTLRKVALDCRRAITKGGYGTLANQVADDVERTLLDVADEYARGERP